MVIVEFERETKKLIDSLKAVCANFGLGNDGNEFKIITQVFLYKFLNDKFAYEIKKIDENIKNAPSWEEYYTNLSQEQRNKILRRIGAKAAKLKPEYLITHLFNIQDSPDFAQTFDDTLHQISIENNDIFSVKTEGGAKIELFDTLSKYIIDDKDAFFKAIINKLVAFSFENIFNQKYDFYATIFEYLIKDYNSDSGGKYAEYYTPHAVAKIMAAIMVDEGVANVTCYDPSAGSGTLLMNIAHAIGEDRCSIYSQDISQKSSSLLRLNLILNNLVHSISNVIKGNTLLSPYHKEGDSLQKFDYIVSNPPFKTDFSDYRDDLDSKENHDRFFAGIPKVPAKKKESMAIYSMFLQHIIHSLKKGGKAAVVVPTGFITAQSGIDKKIREHLIEKKMLGGVVSMPSNIFATTGTNVSIIFIDDTNKENVVLIDASNLGKTVKDGKNQKTVLQEEEEQKIIDTFNDKKVVDDFSVVVSYDDIKVKNYSFSAGQYFDVKIEYVDISKDEFDNKMKGFSDNLKVMFRESKVLEDEIKKQLLGLVYED
ncbi:class I SAM-dependent DNA methyltransferase [Arcobacter sp. F2176]|uniref:HsdM family class I SAM-dependent methyltransferase n=1 Tax=Arcobacter sp. F2176 TaxID=2044511 RepID=UPI00100B3C33|nr:class I SAM-dependent DNA methyltransferase [Arcobacter sp. F2176]RXJ82143.1 SAM-dependent methyltransferase [Arcobacter sp. F2176]